MGLAVSDPLGYTAQGLPTLERKDEAAVFRSLRSLCDEKGVGECVVGLPLKLNGEIGPRAKIVLEWVEELKKHLSCPVRTWDERLTSKEAQKVMIRQDLSRRQQKAKSDELSAILILQNYLEFCRSHGGSTQSSDEES